MMRSTSKRSLNQQIYNTTSTSQNEVSDYYNHRGFKQLFCVGASPSMGARAAQQKTYEGAQAGTVAYKAVYQLDSGNPNIIEKALRNVKNVLEDPRLKK